MKNRKPNYIIQGAPNMKDGEYFLTDQDVFETHLQVAGIGVFIEKKYCTKIEAAKPVKKIITAARRKLVVESYNKATGSNELVGETCVRVCRGNQSPIWRNETGEIIVGLDWLTENEK